MLKEKTEKNEKDIFEEISGGIDKEMTKAGLIIGDLFKSVSMAAAHLPNMDLKSDIVNVVVDDDSITVSVTGLSRVRRHITNTDDYEDEDYEDNSYEDDEEEGLIYDEM